MGSRAAASSSGCARRRLDSTLATKATPHRTTRPPARPRLEALAENLASLLVVPERVFLFIPGVAASLDSVAFRAAVDLAFLFALSHGVIGGYLLWTSRGTMVHMNLVPLIIEMELIFGIVDDLYLIFLREYPVDMIYYGFIVLHLVVIGSGCLVYPQGSERVVHGR